jgi:hypothetical protein
MNVEHPEIVHFVAGIPWCRLALLESKLLYFMLQTDLSHAA